MSPTVRWLVAAACPLLFAVPAQAGSGVAHMARVDGFVPLVLAVLSLAGACGFRYVLHRRFRSLREREEAVVFSERYFALLARKAGDIGFKYDAVSGWLNWTADLAAKFLGYAPGKLVLTPDALPALVHVGERSAFEAAWNALAHGGEIDLEFRLQKKDRTWCWVHMYAAPLPESASEGFQAVGVVRSTQLLHVTEDELSEARRMETVGTMAGGIAHEFNNHLTPIRGYIELALDELGDGHACAEGLQTALARVDHCTNLVSQVQAFGRKKLLLPKAEDVSQLLPAMIRLAMSVDRERSEKITLQEFMPSSLPLIWVDQAQLQEAIIQLVGNAYEAMPDGGVLTVRAEQTSIRRQAGLRASPSQQRSYVTITISDTGHGIQPEHRGMVFDPFFTTRGRAKARGMGLSMVQGMVAQHEGHIDLRSAPNIGTDISLFFPVYEASNTATQAENAPVRDDTLRVLPAAPVGRLLIADDEAPIRAVLRRVFEREGWHVEEAADADAVAARFSDETEPPGLLILDLTMPGPPAEETVQTVRQASPSTKVLLISGFVMDARIQRLASGGGIQFAGKPFSTKQILSAVDTLLAA